ncbi:MAG TPA: hypothetical protein PKA80_09960 [Ignavibacteriaceae bacterium]|nr:hypothetical protein [Ignavibacteriaceae bacterium]
MNELSLSSGIELLKAVDKFSQQKIKNRDALHLLFDICIAKDKLQLLEELSFTSKYLNGLARVLITAAGNSDYQNIDNIKKDYSDNILKATDQLKNIVALIDEQTQKKFRVEFLDLNSEAFAKLRTLFEDLEWTKKYLNALKRNELQ